MDTAQWPEPETVVQHLRSPDPQTRQAALLLFGLPENELQQRVWSQTSPSHDAGKGIILPDQAQLKYAAVGENFTQQAIVAIQAGQMAYAAVAVPTHKAWERIAVFSCWCKYELNGDEDTLSDFVHLAPAPSRGLTTPERYELVIRASGGGSGIYVKDEAHYRVVNNTVRRVMGFVSERRNCPMADPCTIEKRWFTTTANLKGEFRSILVTAKGRFPQTVGSFGPDFRIRDLENRHLGPTTCRVYEWDDKAFRYQSIGTPKPCNKLTLE